MDQLAQVGSGQPVLVMVQDETYAEMLEDEIDNVGVVGIFAVGPDTPVINSLVWPGPQRVRMHPGLDTMAVYAARLVQELNGTKVSLLSTQDAATTTEGVCYEASH